MPWEEKEISLKGKISSKKLICFQGRSHFSYLLCFHIPLGSVDSFLMLFLCQQTVFLRPQRQWRASFMAPGSHLHVKAATPALRAFLPRSGCRTQTWCVTCTIEMTLYCIAGTIEERRPQRSLGEAMTGLDAWESLWARSSLRSWSEWQLLPDQTHQWAWDPDPGNIQALDLSG